MCRRSQVFDKSWKGRFLFPALGIVVVGAHIDFYALAFVNSRRVVALTPLIPTVIDTGNRWVRTFRAACILRYHIHEDTAKFHRSVEVPPQLDVPLPSINEVPIYSRSGTTSDSQSTIRFQIFAGEYQGKKRHSNRFIYLAEARPPDVDGFSRKVLVKFTRQYFLPLHQFCAERGHAPRLLGHGVLPDGWQVVVIERIDHDVHTLHDHAPKHLSAWSGDLRQLVDEFHDRGWVHGDLRDANLIISRDDPERVVLVDFD
ncbi:hypothetical protein BJV78DRAFT_151984 [Lactifluus subvellereus]|nr:hypothetical protein BJV78DRAFT_151984 [Lactifluus subvellereus]